MIMTKDEMKDEIRNLAINDYSAFYVGITNDVERRLKQHNVKKADLKYKMRSKESAQDLEEFCLSLGMDGDTGGGNEDSVWVYIYKKTKYSIDSYKD